MAAINLFSIKESNLFNSCNKIVNKSKTYEADLVKVPRFVVLRNNMAVTIQGIVAIQKSYKENPDTTDVTKEKNDQLFNLMEEVGSLAKTVKIIAVSQNDSDGIITTNDALITQTRSLTQEAKLQVASDFADYALTIKDTLLGEYGITKEELLAINPKAVEIRAFLTQKVTIEAQNATNKENLAALLAALEAGKNEMTALIDRYQSHAPKFVTAFNNIAALEVRLNIEMTQKRSEDLQKEKEKKALAKEKKTLAKEEKAFLQKQKPAGKKKLPLSKKKRTTFLETQKLEAQAAKEKAETPTVETDKLL